MKITGLLFISPMVRAVITCRACGKLSVPIPCEHCGADDWLKTQTRRTFKQPPSGGWRPHEYGDVHKMKDGQFLMRKGAPVVLGWGATNADGDEAYVSPLGRAGDRIWVKETWRPQDGWSMENQDRKELEYRATDDRPKEPTDSHWKSPRFMPMWASRLALEVTAVRVERLQDISPEDAGAEGMRYTPEGFWEVDGLPLLTREGTVETYQGLWNHINGPAAWDMDPQVWVTAFRRIPELLPPISTLISQ